MLRYKRNFRDLYQILRVVGGEGNRHLHRTLRGGKRIFVGLKLLKTAWVYSRGPRHGAINADSLALANGPNQLRHHRKALTLLTKEIGAVELRILRQKSCVLQGDGYFPGIPMASFLKQCAILFGLLLTGKERFLNLFYIDFYSAIEKLVRQRCGSVSNFICYNDQPFDMAAVVLAFKKSTGVNTIVVQHGLILNSAFYFPVNAHDFWAWGELSKENFAARDNNAGIVIKGRYLEDSTRLVKARCLQLSSQVSILVAPSHIHAEVTGLLTILSSVISQLRNTTVPRVAIKLHPATKLNFLIKRFCRSIFPGIVFETEDMDVLAEKYDVLLTKNSTSAVDFMLLNKPIFFSNFMHNGKFPSGSYGMPVERLGDFLSGVSMPCLNNNRITFLREALNV